MLDNKVQISFKTGKVLYNDSNLSPLPHLAMQAKYSYRLKFVVWPQENSCGLLLFNFSKTNPSLFFSQRLKYYREAGGSTNCYLFPPFSSCKLLFSNVFFEEMWEPKYGNKTNSHILDSCAFSTFLVSVCLYFRTKLLVIIFIGPPDKHILGLPCSFHLKKIKGDIKEAITKTILI